MPWPEKQRIAIFLNTKRTQGEAAARQVMHEAGYGGGTGRPPTGTGRRRRRRRVST